MSTFPREQRFIFDAVLRHGRPDAIAAFRRWLTDHPDVLDTPTESELPAALALYAVTSLKAVADEMEKVVHLDGDMASDQENDRLVMLSIADRIKRDLGVDAGVALSH